MTTLLRAVLSAALLLPGQALAAPQAEGGVKLIDVGSTTKSKKRSAKPKSSEPSGTTTKVDGNSSSDKVPQPHAHGGNKGCEFYGATACEDCLLFWAHQGNGMNNHFCKDKSRAAGTKGWDCFNYAEDTSHGYQCIAYCPPDTPTCESNCDQKHPDGSPYHDHPMRQTRNKNTGRVLGPPGFAPEKNQGKEERAKCVW